MTRQDIAETAFRVWGRNFYLDTSLSFLARELGVSKTAIYRHFRDKQALKDTMYELFFDHYADYIREGFNKASAGEDSAESLAAMIRVQTEYFARNPWKFIFCLAEVYNDREPENIRDELLKRGIYVLRHRYIARYSAGFPSFAQMITASLIFWVAHFHKNGRKDVSTLDENPGEDEIKALVAFVEKTVFHGLGLERERTEHLDFDSLEASAASRDSEHVENGILFKAVAEAVAEAGPWNASMDMVARRSGLSKSSLYGHFKNKQDMLRRLFVTEFTHIARFANEGIGLSAVPEEQLYLGIFSIASYLRLRPEILTALSWIRTRRLNLGRHASYRPFRVFETIKLVPCRDWEKVPAEIMSHWIMFLIVNILMRPPEGANFADFPNESIRVLYRFVTLGVEGFQIV
ncbi:MAG: TetR/AcrR family transcriptional regulator [Treponema sp.]|jgi:AcrR family transcriptional regulator|nr:TetR/AcrR family transcriptional regulator [Treponema sp.]